MNNDSTAGELMIQNSKILRFGILGTGWMADIFARELVKCHHASLAAVSSSTPDRSVAFCERFSGAVAYPSYEALIAAPEVDVVYIATTTERHFQNAMTCIEARKPTLVEKPIAMKPDEIAEMILAAKKRDVFLMEAMWTRCFPRIRHLEETLAPIGSVRRMTASFCMDIPFSPNNRLYSPALGGGALLDIGIYPLTLLHRLWGFDGASMTSNLSYAATGVDDAGVLCFDYPDGRTARLDYSLKGHRPHRAIFQGERGTAIFDDFFHPSMITVTLDDAPPGEERFAYPVMGYHYEIEEVAACLSAGRKENALVPLAASAEVLAMMTRVLESSSEK